MKAKIVKKGKQTEKLLKKLNLKSSVQVGHFQDQGQHYSEMSYPELMKLHHVGTGTGPGEIPARPILDILDFRVAQNKRKAFFGVKTVFKEADYKYSVRKYLLKVGERLRKMERAIFGDTAALAGNKPKTISMKQGKNTPLIDTGDLKSKIEVRFKK